MKLSTRPADAKTCPSCGGNRAVSGLPEALAGRIVCQCGGSGWLPAVPAGV
jgi:hypothetical protein